MSFPCMNHVWQQSNQKGAALLLLIAMADYADPNGFAWPGLETLAHKTRLSTRHLSRLLAALQAAGELLVLPRPGRSHLYIVLTGTDTQLLSAALQRAADRGATLDAEIVITRIALRRVLQMLRTGTTPGPDPQPLTAHGMCQRHRPRLPRLRHPLPPLSHPCFLIMSTVIMPEPSLFYQFHHHFNPNLPAKSPHVPSLFPKKISPLPSLPHSAQQPSALRHSSIVRRPSSFVIRPPPPPAISPGATIPLSN